MLPFTGINGSLTPVEDDQGRRIVASIRDDEHMPDATIELEVSGWRPDGQPDIAAITVRPHRKTDVRIPLRRYVDWLASTRRAMDVIGGPEPAGSGRPLTDDFLADVLRVYEAAPKGQRVEAVQATYGGSRGSVYRWLAEARERAEHS